MVVPKIKLNNGFEIPVIGFGTYGTGKETDRIIKDAIDTGYRHFDCAMAYGNEREIGQALRDKIADGSVKREDLYITSKIWNNKHDPECVVETCKKSLKDFGLDYLDLFLIHWPCGFKNVDFDGFFPDDVESNFSDVDYVETYKAMEECVRLGLVKSIGISNFNCEQVDRVYTAATIKPVANQVEVNPRMNNKKLISFCKERKIEVIAYCPQAIANPPDGKPVLNPVVLAENPKIQAIATRHGKTPAQVVLRYVIQLGALPIPKSSKKHRMEENMQVFDFELSIDEMSFMDTLNCNERICKALEMKNHKFYPFNSD